MRRILWFGWSVVVSAVAVSCAERAVPPPPPRVIDLGHALAESDPTWTGERVFHHETVATIAKDGYFGGKFSTEEHFGTHLDAPAHFAADGRTVDRIPADRLVRPAVCINVAAQVQTNEDYRLTLADVQAFERDHGAIAEGVDVLVATGWDARWPDAARYMNVRGGVKHFPGVSVEAARYLAVDRKVAGILIDTASIDYGPSEQFEAHHTTMPAGVYHVENAAGLTALPASGFSVVVAPIKVKDGSGGPARVFALVPDGR